MTKRRNFFQKANVRSYNGRRFQNPYFKNNSNKLGRKLIPIFLILAALMAGFFYVIYGPLLKIETISITGLTTIPNEEVENYIWQELDHQGLRIIPKNHLWFVPVDDLSKKLINEFDLSSAEISMDGSNVNFVVEERILEFVWRVDRSFYFIDLDGVITRELRQNERNTVLQRLNMALDPVEEESSREFAPLQPTMPIIEDKTRTPVNVGDQLFEPGLPEKILSFDLGLRQLAITPLIYERESDIDPWFSVIINAPYKILFDGAGDVTKQLTALGVTLNEYTGQITNYIDLRFENRAYVK
ncbi:MAG: hypothetical protein ABH826_02810 [Patescibacteria group bacterium]